MSDSLVKKAHALYQDGKFEEAKTLYQALNQSLGDGLFNFNITLCDNKRLINTDAQAVFSSTTALQNAALAKQLADTQKLLEHYFALSQTLELKLAGAQTQ